MQQSKVCDLVTNYSLIGLALDLVTGILRNCANSILQCLEGEGLLVCLNRILIRSFFQGHVLSLHVSDAP